MTKWINPLLWSCWALCFVSFLASMTSLAFALRWI